MKFFKDLWLFGAVITVVIVLALAAWAIAAGTDTTDNPSVASTGYSQIVLPIPGNYTGASTKVGVVKFRAPWPLRVLSGSSYVRSTDDASARVHLRAVYSNGTSVFSDMSSTGGQTVSDAVGKNLLDESDVRIDLVGPGVGRTATNPTLTLAVKRR